MTHAAQISRAICCAEGCKRPSSRNCYAEMCGTGDIQKTLAAYHAILESPENVERLALVACGAESDRVECAVCHKACAACIAEVRAILAKMREIGA